MNTSRRSLCVSVFLIAVSLLCGAEEAPRPVAPPPTTYRMVRQGVAGIVPVQWVFIIVTPERYVYVTDYSKLQWAIEQAVPANSTLEWSPGGKFATDLPLDTEKQLDDLKAFCKDHQIKFVQLLTR